MGQKPKINLITDGEDIKNKWEITSLPKDRNNTNYLQINRYNNNAALKTIVIENKKGNIGLGQDPTDDYKLTVNGNVKIEGNINVSGQWILEDMRRFRSVEKVPLIAMDPNKMEIIGL